MIDELNTNIKENWEDHEYQRSNIDRRVNQIISNVNETIVDSVNLTVSCLAFRQNLVMLEGFERTGKLDG